jgi:hypothetical protein
LGLALGAALTGILYDSITDEQTLDTVLVSAVFASCAALFANAMFHYVAVSDGGIRVVRWWGLVDRKASLDGLLAVDSRIVDAFPIRAPSMRFCLPNYTAELNPKYYEFSLAQRTLRFLRDRGVKIAPVLLSTYKVNDT